MNGVEIRLLKCNIEEEEWRQASKPSTRVSRLPSTKRIACGLKIIQAREPVGPGPEDKKSLMHPDWLVIDDTKARSNACLSSGDHVARLTPPLCKQSVTYAQKKCRQKTQKTHQKSVDAAAMC